MYKMHQCAVCSAYLGKAKHHVVYDQKHFLAFCSNTKMIPKIAILSTLPRPPEISEKNVST